MKLRIRRAEFDYDENRDVTVLMSTGEIYSPYPDDNRGRSSFLTARSQ